MLLLTFCVDQRTLLLVVLYRAYRGALKTKNVTDADDISCETVTSMQIFNFIRVLVC